MAHPVTWILLLAAGEVAVGLLLLRGGPTARVGWTGVLAFHVPPMSFGFGFWLWSIPVLSVRARGACRLARARPDRGARPGATAYADDVGHAATREPRSA